MYIIESVMIEQIENRQYVFIFFVKYDAYIYSIYRRVYTS